MFNLEQAVLEWRQQMLAADIKTPVPLEELESHLREEIEEQMKSGIDAHRAFEVAAKEIGKANMLKNEFEKAGGTKEEREWKQIQIMFAASLGLILLFAATCVIFKLGSFSEITSVQQISGLAAIGLTILLSGGGFLSHGFFPVILNKRIRDSICISGGVLTVSWWAIFFFVVLPRVDFTMSQLDVVILWGFVAPFGALAGFIAGLERAARKNSAPANS